MLNLLLAFLNPRAIRAAVALALLLAIAGLYAWGAHQKTARASAEAEARAAHEGLEKANREIERANAALAQIRAQVAETERIMEVREEEKESTREALRAASWTIAQLRRDNAELRAWLDRPIPADVRRVLNDATRGSGQGRKAAATASPAR